MSALPADSIAVYGVGCSGSNGGGVGGVKMKVTKKRRPTAMQTADQPQKYIDSTSPDSAVPSSTPPESVTPPLPDDETRARLERQIQDAIKHLCKDSNASVSIQIQLPGDNQQLQQHLQQQPQPSPSQRQQHHHHQQDHSQHQQRKEQQPKPKYQEPIQQPPQTPSASPHFTTHKFRASPHKKPAKTYWDTRASTATTQFSWDTYLELYPAQPAPVEAFRQPKIYPKNMFVPGMMLQAKDPRKGQGPSWALATVIGTEGLHIILRFMGTDKMNDLCELVDSENIKPMSDNIDDMFAPTNYSGNIGQYQKFVERKTREGLDLIAPASIFQRPPDKPATNMFKPGMKLEATDRKNRDFIYPATVGDVVGDHIKIVFDGWRGSFDYTCEYYSRDIFPINYCRDVGRVVQTPSGWLAMLERGLAPGPSPLPVPAKPMSARASSPKIANKPIVKRRGRPPKSANTSASPKKKGGPRGRLSKTPKSTPKNKNFQDSKKISPKTIVSNDHPYSSAATPEQPVGEDETTYMDDTQEIEILDDIDTSIDVNQEDEGDLMVADPYQCQRTVAYRDWHDKKMADRGIFQ